MGGTGLEPVTPSLSRRDEPLCRFVSVIDALRQRAANVDEPAVMTDPQTMRRKSGCVAFRHCTGTATPRRRSHAHFETKRA
jgi:hypothetical protein